MAKTELLTARGVLYSFCCVCQTPLSWRRPKTRPRAFLASCCGLVYQAEPTDSRNDTFFVDVYEARTDNVITISEYTERPSDPTDAA